VAVGSGVLVGGATVAVGGWGVDVGVSAAMGVAVGAGAGVSVGMAVAVGAGVSVDGTNVGVAVSTTGAGVAVLNETGFGCETASTGRAVLGAGALLAQPARANSKVNHSRLSVDFIMNSLPIIFLETAS